MKRILYTVISYIAKVFPSQSAKRIKAGDTQKWYGRVNYWASGGKKTLRKDLIRCAAEGVSGYHIEMAGWADSSGYRKQWGNDSKMKDVEKMYKFLVRQCRALGLWCFVSIVNDNAGSGKYGDSRIPLSSVRDDVSKLIDIVEKNGSKNVIVQPVGETQTGAGRAIEHEAASKLGGFKLCYNGGSRPSGTNGWHYRAYHPFKVTDGINGDPGNCFVVSDTGSIISQLCHGLDPTGAGKPDHTRDWVRHIKGKGCPVVCFYHFKRKDHDGNIIKVLGDA